jgi:hypothetical protein
MSPACFRSQFGGCILGININGYIFVVKSTRCQQAKLQAVLTYTHPNAVLEQEQKASLLPDSADIEEEPSIGESGVRLHADIPRDHHKRIPARDLASGG